jgi:hypothetical protein
VDESLNKRVQFPIHTALAGSYGMPTLSKLNIVFKQIDGIDGIVKQVSGQKEIYLMRFIVHFAALQNNLYLDKCP